MLIDDVPEYREMRKGLMALRLEVAPSIANDLLGLCEKVILAVRDKAYAEGHQQARLLDALETARGRNRLLVENERLQGVNERDRSQVADVFNAIMEAIRRREWLRLGRGSYEYNDDRWHDEFSKAIDEMIAAAEPLRKIAADWSDCPTDPKEIAAARHAIIDWDRLLDRLRSQASSPKNDAETVEVAIASMAAIQVLRGCIEELTPRPQELSEAPIG